MALYMTGVLFSDPVVVHLEVKANVVTFDYNGHCQTEGGDPIEAKMVDDKGNDVEIMMNDNENGSYGIRFTLHKAVTHCLKVRMKKLCFKFSI